jgi:hypothetical protein
MSKISAIQAEALGLKPAAPKSTITTSVAKKPSAPKPITVNPVAKPVVSAKSVTVKPKPIAKAVVKPANTAGPKAKVAQKVDKKNTKKDVKKSKPEKIKMERDSFTMPKDEYAQIALLKARLNKMGQPAKKSELLRAGIKLLAAMSDNTLKMTLAKIPVIKTGRPNKKG